jgi:hypothetical protein
MATLLNAEEYAIHVSLPPTMRRKTSAHKITLEEWSSLNGSCSSVTVILFFPAPHVQRQGRIYS